MLSTYWQSNAKKSDQSNQKNCYMVNVRIGGAKAKVRYFSTQVIDNFMLISGNDSRKTY